MVWVCDKPAKLLLAEAKNYEQGHPLQQAEFEVVQWPSRSLDEWQREWDSSQFDAICSVLPKLLREAGLLEGNFFRFSYDSATGHGAWFDVDGSKVASCSERFAVLYIETPVHHYALLERGSVE